MHRDKVYWFKTFKSFKPFKSFESFDVSFILPASAGGRNERGGTSCAIKSITA